MAGEGQADDDLHRQERRHLREKQEKEEEDSDTLRRSSQAVALAAGIEAPTRQEEMVSTRSRKKSAVRPAKQGPSLLSVQPEVF